MSDFSNFVQLVTDCQATTKREPKMAALRGADDVSRAMLFEAFSPYRVFGIRKYPEPARFAPTDAPAEIFMALLDKLARRELTGNAGKQAVHDALASYTKETAGVLALVLNKDLKAGFSGDTVNKIYEGLIPSFSVMLANKMSEKYQWKFPLLVEAKLDGERTIAICENGVVTYYSRSGKIAEHCAGLFDGDLRRLEEHLGYPVVIDGERYAGDFTRTMNAKKEGNSQAKNDLRLYAFDYMALITWKDKNCAVSQLDRRNRLKKILVVTGCEKIILSKGKVVHSQDEAKDFYNEMLDEHFEGLILKDVNGAYCWDRSPSWTKWKPCFPVDGKIVGFYSGKAGSRLANTLGGIYVEGEDENGNKFECSCGSGFSDEQRAEIWNNQNEWVSKMVELEYQEMSMAANSDVFSLRFPVFVRRREDKDAS